MEYNEAFYINIVKNIVKSHLTDSQNLIIKVLTESSLLLLLDMLEEMSVWFF